MPVASDTFTLAEAFDRLTVKVSLFSSSAGVSSIVGTSTVFVVWPGVNVRTVADAAV